MILNDRQRLAADSAITGGATSGHWQYAALASIADSLAVIADVLERQQAQREDDRRDLYTDAPRHAQHAPTKDAARRDLYASGGAA